MVVTVLMPVLMLFVVMMFMLMFMGVSVFILMNVFVLMLMMMFVHVLIFGLAVYIDLCVSSGDTAFYGRNEGILNTGYACLVEEILTGLDVACCFGKCCCEHVTGCAHVAFYVHYLHFEVPPM